MLERLKVFLNYGFHFGENVHITIRTILIVAIVLILTILVLRILKRVVVKKLPVQDKPKFNSVFLFTRYFVYLIVMLVTFDNIGVNVTGFFAASAALLVGVGLAMQTLFQDIFSGIFILIDQSVHVGDIIEIDGKVGRVTEIKLRTTRAVTIDNKVLVIPNHKYLVNTIYNWTENGSETIEKVSVGVAYGSDLALVKQLLIQVATNNKNVLKDPKPSVLFTDFGDSALSFEVKFTLNNSFEAVTPKSEIRFEIDRLFRENNIKIPFPQRELYLHQK